MEKRLVIGFALALLLLEVVLAWHYIGAGMLLGDQLDQLMQFRELLRLGKPQALYGPWMSGTSPIVYNFGPLFSMVLGLLQTLGLNPDQCQGASAIAIALSVAMLVYVMASGTSRERCLGVLLAALIVAAPAFQSSLSFIWVNNWLPSAGLAVLASMIACLHAPTRDGVVRTAALWLLGMHLHSVAFVGLPMVLAAAYAFKKSGPKAAPERLKATTWVLLALAMLPYAIAELWSGFSNTRSLITYLTHHDAAVGGHGPGWAGARHSLQQVASVMDDALGLGVRKLLAWLVGIYACVRIYQAIKHCRRHVVSVIDYLWLCFVGVLLLQMLYLIGVNRAVGPGTFHYVSYPTVFYWLPWAEMGTLLLLLLPAAWQRWRLYLAVLAAAAIALIPATKQPNVTPEYAFAPMRAAVAAICEQYPVVQTFNSGGFENGVGLAYHMNVVEYLVRFYSKCTLRDDAPVLIFARLPGDGPFPPTFVTNSQTFTFVERKPPGIGVYVLAGSDHVH